jgi:hypothetical protein
MSKITEIYAFVTTEKSGKEGMMFAEIKKTMYPLMIAGNNIKQMDSLRKHADNIAKRMGVKYKVLHFKLVGEVE